MGGSSPCAACKLLRRRCAQDCIFAAFFPSDDPHKFAIVHKVFGASNVGKMLQDLPFHQRADAVSSLVYEANARMRDPVYGCVGAISYLQNQVSQLQVQLAMAQAEILCIQMQLQVEAPQLPPQLTQQHIVDGAAGHAKAPFLFDGGGTAVPAAAAAAAGLAPHQLASLASSGAGVAPEALKKESLWT